MKKNFSYRLARYTSTIFVPPSFTFLTFVYITLYIQRDESSTFYILTQGLILGLILPIIFFAFLNHKSLVSDIDATIKEERVYPYLFGIILSCVGIILNWFLGYNTVLVIWIIYFISLISLLTINKYWKISAHAVGVSIPMGLLIYFVGATSLYYIPMILLICWARIYLRKHSLLQVLTGVILGIVLSFTILQFL